MKTNLLALLVQVTMLPAQIVTNFAHLDATTGMNPYGELTVVNGAAYFTCAEGGTFGDGTLAVYVPGSGVFKLVDLVGPTTGRTPRGGFAVVGTDLYFTCSEGGVNNIGTLSKYSLTTGLVTKLFDLTPQLGINPSGTPLIIGNNLYFTNLSGGQPNLGTVLWFDLGSGQLAGSWVFGPSSGATPGTGLVELGGNIYLLCSAGGYGYGTLTRLDAGATNPSVYQLTTADGTTPRGAPIAVGQSLYFTCNGGGAHGFGTLATYDTASAIFQKLADLGSPTSNGSHPLGSLFAENGRFYFPVRTGMTGNGGIVLWNGSINPVAPVYPAGTGTSPESAPTLIGNDLLFLVPFGGQFGGGTLNSMPLLPHADSLMIGQGCGSGTVPPQLTVAAPTVLGNTTILQLAGGPPLSLGYYLASGLTPTITTISPGCDAYLDLATLVPLTSFVSTPFGASSLVYALPQQPLFAGARVRVQAVLFPAAAQVELTNALELTFGY